MIFESKNKNDFGLSRIITIKNCCVRWEYKGNPVNLMRRRDQRKSDVFIKEAERLMGDSMTSYYTTSDNQSRLTPSSSPETPEPASWSTYKDALVRNTNSFG